MALTSDGEVEYDSVLHSYYSSKPHFPLLLLTSESTTLYVENDNDAIY